MAKSVQFETGPSPVIGFIFGFIQIHNLFIEIPASNTNSVDPDPMLHFPASDLGLHCLQRFFLVKEWVTKIPYGKPQVPSSR